MQKRVIIAEDEHGTEECFTSVTEMCRAITHFKQSTIYKSEWPMHYKGYELRRVPLNRRWEE